MIRKLFLYTNFLALVSWLQLFSSNKRSVEGIWPPPYSINLSHEETFIISEPLERKDVQDVYDEEEMIKEEEMEQMKIRPQREKFFRIHQHTRNSRANVEEYDFQSKQNVPKESNPDIEEPLPWKAGFVDENGKFLKEKGMIYFDEEAKSDKDDVIEKRGAEKDGDSYDYAKFKADYISEVKKEAKSNETLQYTTVKEDESVKDSVKSLIDFKETPRNCTKEEMTGIGMGAVECFWLESKKPRTTGKYRVFEKTLRIFIIWTVVYLVIAIPCWCQYGWCCCCCRCKFCSPLEQIDEIKAFAATNPAGVFHDEEGNKIKYKATHYERYAQRKLEQEINRL